MNIIGFKTAKLAKEKGYREKSFYYYDDQGKSGLNFEISSFVSSTALFTYLNFKEDFNKSKGRYSAPYMYELLDWLRIKHKLYINIIAEANITADNYVYNIYFDSDGSKFTKTIQSLNKYSNYDECLEVALEQSLKLINYEDNKFKISITMETIEIQKSNVQAAFKAAGENPEIQVCLRHLFGNIVEPEQAQDNRPVIERIKSYEDACRELGIKPIDTRVSNQVGDLILDDNTITYMKLRTIVDALNEGWKPEFTKDEYRWYPWFFLYTKEELDYMEDSEKKERRMIDTGDYQTEYAGFGSAYSSPAPSNTYAYIGTRLCLKSSELAVYCGKQFIKLWADYNLIRK